mmetsp:Transcript_29635/g.29385  ORF Transcript_29635/g.29385 Transcript_29635/m.29385 type:complete len:113 (+) Transcript_29635:526-864(+)
MVMSSSNPKADEWWTINPDTYEGKTSSSTRDAFLRGITDVHQQAPQVRAPFLLIHGAHDEVVPVEMSREFFRNSGATDKEFAYDENLYHLISLEAGIPQVLNRIVEWIQARI